MTQQTEASLMRIFNSVTDPFVIYDRNYHILQVNPAFSTTFQRPPEQLLGNYNRWLAGVHPEDREILRGLAAKIVELADDVLAAMGFTVDDLQVFLKGFLQIMVRELKIFHQPVQQGFRKAGDGGQRIIDLVGDTVGQKTDGRHPVGLHEIKFALFANRYVPHT